ncbi:MAG TPA: GLUG motif-containing protein [Sedimentisphaerales bacterium]|nr:GLUG motif-containing protein [Sedimentisphaerales bacterium]HRS09971.1 GLUG motif-containing protein [Sedimentisphaerales bacterium]HRV46677.1 GLUG motif-containing protein [Sedimentisphaerales bacterium]
MATPTTFRAYAAIALFLALVCPAPAAEQIDQSNLPEWAGGWTHVNPAGDGQAAMWQTFTPACTNLTAVEIDILTISPGRGDDVLTVEIAAAGVVLASAERSVEDGFDGLLRFEFPEAVPLVPEQLHELKVHDTGKGHFGWKYGSNTYEQGSRYVFAQERPGTDWFFRTYATVESAATKYSGGTGEPNDPYQIATAADLIALGETPEDYDKHFLLTADIDLDPNLPGGKIFDKAIIASDMNDVAGESGNPFDGTPFTGVFDGNDHTISRLTITGGSYLGLFGQLRSPANVSNLRLEAVEVAGDMWVAGLVAVNGLTAYAGGSIANCYSNGSISGDDCVGGLVGSHSFGGGITNCHSSATVNGSSYVGGLVGYNYGGIVTSNSSGSVAGTWCVGGLVGRNGTGWSAMGGHGKPSGEIAESYSTASVSGETSVGGLVGYNAYGSTTSCYSTGYVRGDESVGGLVGFNKDIVANCYSIGLVSGTDSVGGLVGGNDGAVIACFWDREASDQPISAGGIGQTTAQMLMASTFASWGACEASWTIDEGRDYPRLAWEDAPGEAIIGPMYGGGAGTAQDPYLIYTPEDMNLIGLCWGDWDKHFKLMADIDMSAFDGEEGRPAFNVIGSGMAQRSNINIGGLHFVGIPFMGVLDGNGHMISRLTVIGRDCLGLFGCLADEAEIKDLGVVDVNIVGSGSYVGALAGLNEGCVSNCYGTGKITGGWSVGGLVGYNDGSIATSYSSGSVSGTDHVGGLVGGNERGSIATSYSGGSVIGTDYVGGLVGYNYGSIATSYSSGSVSGTERVGGLVGSSCWGIDCFWDIQTSGQSTSSGGTGKTTAEMQTAKTFFDAGWDFVGETNIGTDDIWWILEGQDYPRLWWEAPEIDD